MSATETPVNSVAVTYPLGSQISCVSSMPVSSPNPDAEILNDDGIGTENSNDFSLNLKDTLQGLQSLNGQSQLTDEQLSGSKMVSSLCPANNGTENKKCNEYLDNGEVVLLDDSDDFSGSSDPKVSSNSTNDENNFNTSNNSKILNHSENSRSNAFAINDKVRSSFRDIMTKIQVNTPSLGNLLSKTKYLDCKDPNCKNLAEKNRIESEQLQQNGNSSRGSGNLFENFQDLGKDGASNNINNQEDAALVTSAPEVIELDESIDEDSSVQAKQNEKDIVASTETPICNDQDKHLCDTKEYEGFSDNIEQSGSLDNSVLIISPEKEAVNSSKPAQKIDNIKDNATNDDNEKHDCDIKSNQVQSSDNNMEVEDSVCVDTKQPSEKNEDLGTMEENLLDSGPKGDNEMSEDKNCLDDGDQEMKDVEEDEMKEEEEDKLLASDSEEVGKDESEDSRDVKMESEDDVKMESDDDSEGDDKVVREGDDKVVRESDDKVVKEGDNKVVEPFKDEEESLDEKPVLDEKPILDDIKLDSVKSEISEKDNENDKQISVKEEKLDVKEEKPNVIDNIDKHDENSNDSSDRKRPADADSLNFSEPKRSRLDFVIGKLGTQIGIKPESLPLDDDVVSDTEDSTRPDSEESSKSDDTSSSVSETEETEETEEEKSPKKKRKKKPIRLTTKELENIIKSKIRSYMKSERPGIIQELQEKVEELQEANEKWKQKAKDLEKQMLDLTVLQQKVEKRKAKTAALRQISCKSVAVQVDENKANMMSKLGQQHSTTSSPQKQVVKTPPKSTVALTIPASQVPVTPPAVVPLSQQRTNSAPTLTSVPPKLTPMALPQGTGSPKLMPVVTTHVPPPQAIPVTLQSGTSVLQSPRTVFPTNQTVKSLLDVNRTVGNSPKFVAQPPSTNFIMVSTTQHLINSSSGGAKTVLSKANSSIAQAIAVAANNQQIAQGNTSGTVKVIDLTGEEENAAKKSLLAQTTPVPMLQSQIRQPVFTQQVMRPVIAGQPQNQGILFSTPAGTQIVRPGGTQAYQLLFNPTSPAIRPGSLLTVVSAPSSSAQGIRPPSTFIPTMAQTTISAAPPQLKTAQLMTATNVPKTVDTVMKTVSAPIVRPPPPLQSAPVTKPEEYKKSLLEPSHPAPLPPPPIYHVKPNEKPLPPQPMLKISRVSQGIVLSWNMTANPGTHADIASYQLFAYQEGSALPNTCLWKKVGDVKALPLPMACTLTQFQEGNHYHFAVRPIDTTGRVGPFSRPSSIHLTKKDK